MAQLKCSLLHIASLIPTVKDCRKPPSAPNCRARAHVCVYVCPLLTCTELQNSPVHQPLLPSHTVFTSRHLPPTSLSHFLGNLASSTDDQMGYTQAPEKVLGLPTPTSLDPISCLIT